MGDSRHRALARGLRILEAIADARNGLTITELCKLTGVEKSTTSRLVATLVDLGFLARMENRRVVLTGRILHMAKGFQEQFNLSEIARPYLIELRDKVGETTILTIREGNQTVSIDQFDPDHPFRLVPHVGNTAPIDATAAGRAMLFTLPVAEQHRVLEEIKDTPVEHPEVRLSRQAWAKELERFRSRGYVWIPRSDDVERVAAVALDRNGQALAAVSIYGPKYRMGGRIGEFGIEAKTAASKVSRAAFGVRSGELP